MTYRSLNKFNEEKFKIDLIQSDFYNIERIDPGDALSSIYIINTTLEIHTPIKTKRIKRAIQPETSISKEILNASKLRNMYQKQQKMGSIYIEILKNRTSYLIRKIKEISVTKQ